MSKTGTRLKEIGVVLPKPAAPVANYVPSVRAGSLLFVSGQLPIGDDGKLSERHQGKLSANSEVDSARDAARLCVINVLAQAHAALGDLDRVKQVVRLGRHARTTVGVAHLPLNALAEVEAVFEIEA
jgi:enamine deaminase RidA (YjgF/YER057c/UK114 family)